ncbi:hypothetical protein [Sandaracinus amylolyticus]|uniref:Tryptophan synthase alpha chain n=1 Tax=Sandaracinus amylolyticus TaxID=927083 RepID=A0A0F6W1Q1_9BACT|nr:hypothetical protein [Sandaracinus amylolyticus]AKF05186.1 Tryptophan synthase alpha chain [Sandaracinus amylolyticus]
MHSRISALLLFGALLVAGCDGEGGAPPTDDAGACERGTLGCECARGDRCGVDSAGDPLMCIEGACLPADCAPGSMACVCRASAECDGDALECREGVCRGTECSAGDMGCECLAGTCGPGLYCDRSLGGGTCVDDSGWPGGDCPASGLCRAQSRCEPITGTCVPCSLGSQGCDPLAGGACNEGLVLSAGRCLPLSDTRPDEPRCYSTCRDDLVETDGTVRRCGADGLLEGCIDGRECVDGQCLVAGESPRTCAEDAQCPEFQRCLGGSCVAQCDADVECGIGFVCHMHACRAPCARNAMPEDACPTGTFCDSQDGRSGVCMPVGDEDGADVPDRGPEAGFTLSAQTMLLGDGAGLVRLTHESHSRETFRIERIAHTAYDETGAEVELADRRELDRPADAPAPLRWLELRYGAESAVAGDLEAHVEPGECDDCPFLEVRNAAPPAGWARWEGLLRISHPEMGERLITLAWSRGLDGRWAGSMFYFGNFDARGVQEWLESDNRDIAPPALRNALLQRWIAFRAGRVPGGVRELDAMLTGVRTESWRWASTRSACAALHGSSNAACYLFDGGRDGLGTFTTNVAENPVPTAISTLPLVLNLRADPGRPLRMAGRIESSGTLHAPGDPGVVLDFADDPSRCRSGTPGYCLARLAQLESTIVIGARTTEGSACPAGLEVVERPWLVPGFVAGTELEADGARVYAQCHDTRLPFAESARNVALAGANPIPDGRPAVRELRVLDGFLLDRERIVVLFEERRESWLDPSDTVSAFGYAVLARSPEPLAPEDLQPGAIPELPDPPPSELGLTCSPEMVELATGRREALSAINAAAVTSVMLTGMAASPGAPLDRARVHAYCEDTGLIDGGPGAAGSPAVTIACPVGSRVTYFAFVGASAPSPAMIAGLPCQQGYDARTGARGTCSTALESWRATDDDVLFDVPWICEGTDFCNADRHELRAGKRFYPATQIFLPIEPAIEEAFRYRLRFQSRDGRAVGFAPAICDPASELTPFCYDPAQIEEIRARIDCLAAAYSDFGVATTDVRTALSTALGAVEVTTSTGIPLLADGFERLFAELMILLGDEALTNAYRSRFDVAATRGSAFRGSELEADGIDLTGVAGFEMLSLYQAVQSYQVALDRLYHLAPVMQAALARGHFGADGDDVVSAETVTWYMERVIRGAAQKALALSEIAKRYEALDRTDLARGVLERAYAGSYMESVAIAQLMTSIADRFPALSRDQLVRSIEDAQRRYSIALTEMRAEYEALSDDVTYFGYPADYVPIPVRDSEFRGSNAFEDVLGTTDIFLAEARRAEDEAIASSRAFDTDSEQFQAELVRVRRGYEERLGPICGYFAGRDGRTYPAIAEHAFRSDATSAMQDPCGAVGNGEIHQQIGRIQQLALQRQTLETRYNNILADIADEQERVNEQCDLVLEIADFEYRVGETTLSMQHAIRGMQLAQSTIDRTLSTIHGILGFASGPSGNAALAIGWGITAGIGNGSVVVLQGVINELERDIQETQLSASRWRTERECDRLRIDSVPSMNSRLRSLQELTLETYQVALQIELAMSDLQRLRLQARRVEDELADAEQLSIRVAAVQNDPNVRLFRNQAILSADRTFEIALRQVYRLTRVYEYYTSQTYPGRDRLFQIRMVARGEDNLVRYINDLRERFLGFEEEFRAPASRVERLSLMDDIFQIPRVDGHGDELDINTRQTLFREALTSSSLLSPEGHVVIPFQTTLAQVSPCTRNHKINFIEVSILGSGLGDDEATVMVWHEGTSVVESLYEGTQYYRLPPGLSIAQAYFGRNNTVFDPSVYRRYEFRERPFLSTQWSLELDLRDEPDNHDLRLDRISDVYLYVYYTDFTDPRSCRR